jgi:hypothetical protein
MKLLDDLVGLFCDASISSRDGRANVGVACRSVIRLLPVCALPAEGRRRNGARYMEMLLCVIPTPYLRDAETMLVNQRRGRAMLE